MGWTRVLAAALAGSTVALVAVAWSLAAWLGWSWALVLQSFMITNGMMALRFGGCGGILAWLLRPSLYRRRSNLLPPR